MILAFIKALTLLQERSFWRVIWHSILITVAAFIGLYGLVWVVLTQVSIADIWWIDTLVDVLGGLAVLVLTWLLFPAVATLVMVVLNLLALPLYFVPVLNLIVFYGVNAYLLGREYFELVAMRRLDPRSARWLHRSHRLRFFVAGLLATALLTLPVVNLVAPLLSAAFMLHLVMALRSPFTSPTAPDTPHT
jgi:CysZ protein